VKDSHISLLINAGILVSEMDCIIAHFGCTKKHLCFKLSQLCLEILDHIQAFFKGKFYRTAVRLTLLYGTECWAVKSQHENQVSVTEMRMLCWMSGKTRHDRIRNDTIR